MLYIIIAIYLFGGALTGIMFQRFIDQFETTDDVRWYTENFITGRGTLDDESVDKAIKIIETVSLWLWPLFWVLVIYGFYQNRNRR